MPLPLLVTASCPAPLSAKTPLIVLAPVLAPLSDERRGAARRAGGDSTAETKRGGTAARAAGEGVVAFQHERRIDRLRR